MTEQPLVRVLYIDDDPTDYERIKSRMESTGEVMVGPRVDSAAGAVPHLDGTTLYDLLLVDVYLDGGAGGPAVPLFRHLWQTYSLPIVAVTSAPSAHVTLQLVEAGAWTVLDKTQSAEVMVNIVIELGHDRAGRGKPDEPELFMSRELRRAVRAIEDIGMDADVREILIARENGLKPREIADRLGVAETTIDTKLSRVTRRLADYLQREDRPTNADIRDVADDVERVGRTTLRNVAQTLGLFYDPARDGRTHPVE